MKSKGITEITIQPEFPKQNEEDLEDGLKNLIQVNFKNNYFLFFNKRSSITKKNINDFQTSSPTCQQSNCLSQRCCCMKDTKLFSGIKDDK